MLVTPLAVALAKPLLAVAVFHLATSTLNGDAGLADQAMGVVLFALTLPRRNRLPMSGMAAARGITLLWLALLIFPGVVGWLTDSLRYFKPEDMLTWAVITPLLLWQDEATGTAVYRKSARQQKSRRTAVMVGAGPLGVAVAHALEGRRSPRTRLVGWCDDRRDDRVQAEASPGMLGGLADLAPYVLEHGIKEVYITLPLHTQRMASLLDGVLSTTASVYYVPDMPGVGIIPVRLHDMNGVPMVGLYETPFTGINGLVKRASDLMLGTLIIALVAPLMLALAIGVKLSSPGPVLFKQRRNGLDGEEIMVYKFRSMTCQDNGDCVTQARRNDPRVTRLGHFMRRTSLDELPQFFNVLQGCMSIVGPRPHAVAHNEQYRQIIKAYMMRHKIKPGITGWAQVNGLRGETDTVEKMKARLEKDLEYLRTWSLWMDIKIILRSIRLVFIDRQAY